MTTKLEKPLKREIQLDGAPYIVTLSPEGIKIVEKGKRKGQEVSWGSLLGGKVALSQALKDSVDMVNERDRES